MFEYDIKKLLNAYQGAYELIEFRTDNYLEKGFEIFIKMNFNVLITNKRLDFRSARSVRNGNVLFVSGWLNDINWILNMYLATAEK